MAWVVLARARPTLRVVVERMVVLGEGVFGFCGSCERVLMLW